MRPGVAGQHGQVGAEDPLETQIAGRLGKADGANEVVVIGQGEAGMPNATEALPDE